MRYLYSVFNAFKYYGCLRLKKKQALSNITQLTPRMLKDKSVKCLALDFDGVLNSHAELFLAPNCKQWLDQFIQVWPQNQIVILSNKPNLRRIKLFNDAYPEITFCRQVRKKPYPDGIQQIAKLKSCTPQEILLVDDRLLTGMLACCISGAQGLLIKHPYKKWLKRPIREIFFATLRTLERCFIV